MQLVELMHQLGVNVCADALSKSADGAYHIAATFQDPIYVILYLVGLGALWFHLTHGFWSALQTIGFNNQLWFNRWKCIGNIYATIIVFGFAIVAIAYFIKSVCC
jgi:succinate dehydrogenase / fumarate reductase cytochrome b subunit